MSDKNP